jgi:hypothetical protein
LGNIIDDVMDCHLLERRSDVARFPQRHDEIGQIVEFLIICHFFRRPCEEIGGTGEDGVHV